MCPTHLVCHGNSVIEVIITLHVGIFSIRAELNFASIVLLCCMKQTDTTDRNKPLIKTKDSFISPLWLVWLCSTCYVSNVNPHKHRWIDKNLLIAINLPEGKAPPPQILSKSLAESGEGKIPLPSQAEDLLYQNRQRVHL